MTKRLSKIQKENIIKLFKIGKTVEYLATKFNFSKLTISRNLKKDLGEIKYKELLLKSKTVNQISDKKAKSVPLKTKYEINISEVDANPSYQNKLFILNSYF